MRLLARPKSWGLSFALFATALMIASSPPRAPAKAENESTPAMEPGPAPAMATGAQLEELVSPIALYPDVLVAQILAASTYPDQVVEAWRWLKQNPKLSGEQLGAALNSQPWDPSVKSLAQFPTVLQTMNDSLAWTSDLGQAYYNQPSDVMSAIQRLYIHDGKMDRGFAFLAYPAEYRASGVMTFMIDQDGVIVQKDLGPDTLAIAGRTVEFNPDKSWDQVLE